MNKSTIFNLIISGLLLLSIGLFSGFAMGYAEARRANFSQFKQVRDLNPNIATIKFMKHENGVIFGQIDGKKVRIAYSPDDISDLNVGEAFEIPTNKISLGSYYASRDVPEGMAYISSKTGKYYYHVLDPASLRITPKNRLYFTTEAEARDAGFLPKN